jgi:hypothetical protein
MMFSCLALFQSRILIESRSQLISHSLYYWYTNARWVRYMLHIDRFIIIYGVTTAFTWRQHRRNPEPNMSTKFGGSHVDFTPGSFPLIVFRLF